MTSNQNEPQFSLVPLTLDANQDIYQMLQELPKDEQGFQNMFHGLSFDEFKRELTKREKESRGENLAEGRVPQSIYWFYLDNQPAGMVKIRHYLNDYLRENGGHIGYGLAPQYRGKGYGNKMLELALIESRNLGIAEALLTCNKDNEASKAVIIKNGGKLEKETESDAFYWIQVSGSGI